LLLCANTAFATKVVTKPLNELVDNADHVVQVSIVNVDMIDSKGNVINDPDARTGPGLENTIRLHAEVQDKGILKTNTDHVPEIIVVELWPFWHYSLGQIQNESTNQDAIFLLKGESFEPITPSHFQRPVSERSEIIKLIK